MWHRNQMSVLALSCLEAAVFFSATEYIYVLGHQKVQMIAVILMSREGMSFESRKP